MSIDHRGRILFDESEGEWHLYVFAEKPGRWAWLIEGEKPGEIIVLCTDRAESPTVGSSATTNFSDALRIAKEWIDKA